MKNAYIEENKNKNMEDNEIITFDNGDKGLKSAAPD